MDKITSIFGGHKKEGEETHGQAMPYSTVEHGQSQDVRHDSGEKKHGGMFGFGGHKGEEKHEVMEGEGGKTGLFGHSKKNKGGDSSSSSSESEGEDTEEKQKKCKERKEKKKLGYSNK